MTAYACLSSDGSNIVTGFVVTDTPVAARDGIVVLSQDAYEKWHSVPNLFYENGTFVRRDPPPPPLSEQAQAALSSARQIVYQNYGIINEPTPSEWVTYLKTLMAIANGADTKSTELPVAPQS